MELGNDWVSSAREEMARVSFSRSKEGERERRETNSQKHEAGKDENEETAEVLLKRDRSDEG